jgi:hypothetical protein
MRIFTTQTKREDAFRIDRSSRKIPERAVPSRTSPGFWQFDDAPFMAAESKISQINSFLSVQKG